MGTMFSIYPLTKLPSTGGVGASHIPSQRFGYPLHNHVCEWSFRRCEMFSTPRIPALKSSKDHRMVIWFDIDNTLYSASTKISHAMGERIHGTFTHNGYRLFLKAFSAAYFVSLGIDEDEASELHHKYYKQYGLALRGLTRHHDIGICIE